jgi:hypothetical protein
MRRGFALTRTAGRIAAALAGGVRIGVAIGTGIDRDIDSIPNPMVPLWFRAPIAIPIPTSTSKIPPARPRSPTAPLLVYSQAGTRPMRYLSSYSIGRLVAVAYGQTI